ncbi:MAG: hypothetical protein ACREU7_06690, partial [Burkholderiales bacterium]
MGVALTLLPVATASARGLDSMTPLWWVGISVGIALALLTGALVLLNARLRTRRERDLFASSLDTLPMA